MSRALRVRFAVVATLAAAVVVAAVSADAANPRIIVATGSHAVLGSVTAENEDLAVCEATALGEGTSACTWSLLFDGSAAGLNTSIRAVELLPGGSLVMAVNADDSIPDLSAIKSKDLALFIPSNPFLPPFTSGEWRLYLDGDAVKGASDARKWDAVAVIADGTCENQFPPTCDVLLSLPGGAALGGVSFGDEDILKCHPNGWSVGGAITSCLYSMFFDSSAVNAGGAGSFTGNLFAFDVIGSDTIIFRGPSTANLPSHETARDLLRYVGTFGTSPVGTTDFYFDGSTAGLAGETIQAMGIAPDNCGNGVVNPPFETCDLGSLNGVSGSGCSSQCRAVGACTTSGTPCELASDCPSGEGCCGNAIVETPEACDDGNRFDDDTCSLVCTLNPTGIPILGCDNSFGPHVIPGFVKKTGFKDTADVVTPGFDKWNTRGDFNLSGDAGIDPDSELVQITFNQATPGIVYQASLVPPGKFLQSGKVDKPKWKFKDKEADVPQALGWRKATFSQKLNKVKFSTDGRFVAVPVDMTQPIKIRQSIHIGNECVTTVLACEIKSGGKGLKCIPAVP